jgi:cbb3-type cytochrome oxidase subunit 3
MRRYLKSVLLAWLAVVFVASLSYAVMLGQIKETWLK